ARSDTGSGWPPSASRRWPGSSWAIGFSTACVTRLRRKCDDGGPRADRGAEICRGPDLRSRTSDVDTAATSDRSLARLQDLSPLQPSQAVRDAEERAPVA